MKNRCRHVPKLFLIGIVIFLSHCSADTDSPGNCQLSCSDAKIAPVEAKIRLLSSKLATACEGVASGSDYPQSIPVQFIIEKSVAPVSDSTDTNTTISTVPLAGVSFEPLITGGLMATNPNDPNGPAKYKGIFTDQSEWCTDSCGVGLVEIVPLCFPPNSNDVGLEIHSGPVGTSTTINVGP